MINYIWFFMVASGIVIGVLRGKGMEISKGIIDSSGSAVELIIGLLGIMCFWCGVMKIAEKSGLTEKMAKLLKPLLKIIFKDAAKDEKALGAIVMNITANVFGLSNAATPFGIKAMEEMQKLNKDESKASDDMALFLVLNAACIQLVPSTVISIRAACNSQNPAVIVMPAIIATGGAAIAGIIASKILEKYF
ncbi:MAG: nucleoside recognition domain-containing protein [Clostridiaceae bacterium]